MGVLGERSWCFCSGGGRSERVKGSIFSSKGPAMAAVTGGGGGGGSGFLIHHNLLLTTHACLPFVTAAESAEVQIHHGRLPAHLVPHRFFITSSILDLTIVGLDTVETDSNSQGPQPHYLKTCCNPSLELGSMVYLLGHTDKKELVVGEGKVVIATDNLIKLSTDGIAWSPGSAGFDVQGNLAFMVCDPMRLALSPTAKSSSASSSSSHSWKKDFPMQFGIPIPIICDWLYQHWEGSLDELSKPKLPLIRLMSTGQKSEHSCASFAMRRVFKSTEVENDGLSSPSQIVSGPRYQIVTNYSADPNTCQDENQPTALCSAYEQRIPTPEIYETPRLTSGLVRKKENTQIPLLDINFPPRAPRSTALPLPIRQLLTDTNGSNSVTPRREDPPREDDEPSQNMGLHNPEAHSEITPCRAEGECCSVQSSSSPVEVSEFRNEGDGFSSEGETMYSAETMESRNYPSPKQDRLQQVGRSQSCVSYNRWGSAQRNSAARSSTLQKQHSLTPVRKTHSSTAPVSQKGHDFYSPTVSSIMKKRNDSEQRSRTRQSVAQVSPRWI